MPRTSSEALRIASRSSCGVPPKPPAANRSWPVESMANDKLISLEGSPTPDPQPCILSVPSLSRTFATWASRHVVRLPLPASAR